MRIIEQVRQYVKDYFPEIRPHFFHTSLLSGFIVMIILCLREFQDFQFPRNNFFDTLTYILDPFAVQLLSIFFLIYFAYKYFSKVSSNVLLSFLVPMAFVGSILLFEIITEECIFKPTFLYDRPENYMVEPWLTDFIYGFKRSMRGEGTSTPSGFAFRQTFILLFFIFLAQQKNWKNIMGIKRKYININLFIYILNVAILIMISFSRIYRRSHFLLDIGIGIGLGTFLFWLLTVIVCFFAHKEKQRDFLRDLSFPAITYTITILFYSQDTVYWLIFSFSSLVLIGVLYNKTIEKSKNLAGGTDNG